MRIVAVADTHGFEANLSPVPDGDLFIHAGDLLRMGRLSELEPVAAWIRALPHRHKVVVAGNHDWCFIDDPRSARALLGPTVIYLEDSAAEIAGLRLWGSPWQPEYHSWAFNLPRGTALAEKWAMIPADTDVLITHGPARGLGDRVYLDQHEGCGDLRAALERVQPMLHLCGHIHEDGGLWQLGPSCVVNCTTAQGMRAATVVDVLAGAITPVQIPDGGPPSHPWANGVPRAVR
ncbi:MAG: metallophosphatase domain-containing protein [Myxococcota bacterium]